MTAWLKKVREVAVTVAPVAAIVLLLHLTIAPLEPLLLIRFFIGSIMLIVGMSIFLVGVDLSISPLGELLGENTARSGRLDIVILAGLLLGFFISIAEPALHILAAEIDQVTAGGISRWPLVIIVSIGIAFLVSFGLVRVLYSIPLYIILTALYIVIFVLSLFVSPEYLAIAFDSSGATTGAMAVPFLLSLSLGIARMKKNGKASEKDSFGLVAIASAGAIIAVLIMSLFAEAPKEQPMQQSAIDTSKPLAEPFLNGIVVEANNALLSIAPLFLIFMLSQLFFLKLKKRKVTRMNRGFYYSWSGLVIFMAGVNAGFMDVGRAVGVSLSKTGNPVAVIIVGFVLGLVTILAEPAVHILTEQIEEVTSGSIRRPIVLTALAIAAGTAIALSVIRVMVPGFQLWHILLPGYFIAIILALFGSKLFVGIAFDSGGVASGPMTATFVLAYTQGAASATEGASILVDGFGVIALVALTPIITLQLLGLIYRHKTTVRTEVKQND